MKEALTLCRFISLFKTDGAELTGSEGGGGGGGGREDTDWKAKAMG